jgi:hypothetical protein
MVYFIHFHDFFDGIQKVPLMQEATACGPQLAGRSCSRSRTSTAIRGRPMATSGRGHLRTSSK